MSPSTLAWRSQTEPRHAVLWHETTARPPTLALDGDTTADVVVIGGGASGLWAAWALLDADPALDLLLIDAAELADGASGRGIGACSAWIDGARAPRPVGLAGALLRDAVVEVGGTAAAEQIECDFQYRGAIRAARDSRALTGLRSTIDPAAEDRALDPGALARRVLLPGVLGGVSTPDCATVQPTALLRGLADALLSRGARIAEHTRALRISPGAVLTDQGIVRAERIVQATGASTVPGGEWSPTVVSENAVATVPVPAEIWERIGLRPGQLLQLAGRRELRAVRTADDRLVLVGGAGREVPWRAVSRRVARGSGLRQGRAAAIEVSEADRTRLPDLRRLSADLAGLFPDLAGVALSHTWSWTRAATEAYPVGLRTEGIAWIGGHGPEPFAAANLSGRVLADLLTGADSALTRATSGR